MLISIIDSIASSPLTQDTMEAYTHAMIVHTQSQISSLVGLSESHGTSHRDSGDVPTSGALHQGPGPPTSLRPKTDGTLAIAANNIFELSS
ncbi:hypothetical protein N7481_004902 [Penicillium waksmanii]|uniref:uncharacterized protein n=1 Tax=Penicillium waksmanii TaxID=69791 RepID=UPI002547C034|nr:uncharacterized protein N7481_004902 [Penicillium waksmanii]KAJ5989692.1 hypothetical protein N7481_004902 [Penicillium waksmanii]